MNTWSDRPAYLFCRIFLLVAVLSMAVTAEAGSTRTVYVIPVTGDVGPGMAAHIKRAMKGSGNNSESIFVLEMDTFGGRVDSALQIVDILQHVPESKTVAFVRSKAISAGALIALACNELVMRPGSTIGDCAPITYSSQGVEMMGEKFQSPLRAKFRTLARRNNYPPALAEAMVTAELEVFQILMADTAQAVYLDSQAFADLPPAEKERVISKKTVVAAGELLTMDDVEAHDLGFSRFSASTVEEMLTGLGVTDYQITRVGLSWSEELGGFVSSIAPILLMVGLVALYLEFKVPGFGLPGVVGIICLGGVFFNQYFVGLADYTELVLVVLGVVLLAFEFFVLPGFGIAGLAGFLCLGLGMVLSFQDFVVPDPSLPWQKEILVHNVSRISVAFLLAFVAALLLMRYLLPRLATLVEGPYLATTLADSHADSEETKGLAVGESGVALTLLRPAGKVQTESGQVVDVTSNGEFIEQGTMVEIFSITGNRVLVRRKVT